MANLFWYYILWKDNNDEQTHFNDANTLTHLANESKKTTGNGCDKAEWKMDGWMDWRMDTHMPIVVYPVKREHRKLSGVMVLYVI